MDNDDFLAIEDSLRRFAAVLGVPDLTADRYYRFRGPAGVHYRQSPAAFGVMLYHWKP